MGYKYDKSQGMNPSTLTRDQWECIQRLGEWEESLFRDGGFWNQLYRLMSAEAYSMVADSSGCDTIVSNWNAADAMPVVPGRLRRP